MSNLNVQPQVVFACFDSFKVAHALTTTTINNNNNNNNNPHNPRGRNVAVPAFVVVFSLVVSPRDLYYRGQKNIIIAYGVLSHPKTEFSPPSPLPPTSQSLFSLRGCYMKVVDNVCLWRSTPIHTMTACVSHARTPMKLKPMLSCRILGPLPPSTFRLWA